MREHIGTQEDSGYNMALRLLAGSNRGLTAKVNLVASSIAAVIVAVGGAYFWVLSQVSDLQRQGASIAAYHAVVSELRDAFHGVSTTPADRMDEQLRRQWASDWLSRVRQVRGGLDGVAERGKLGALGDGGSIERALHAYAINNGPVEYNGVETELDVVCDHATALAMDHQRGADAFVRNASWAGLGLLSLLLAGVVVGARAWARREIAVPLTALCGELERTSKETENSATQLDASANRVLAASTIQAEAIQETVAAMNEITAMVAQTTNRAGTSASEARAVLEKTRAGKAVVAEMNEAMQSLTQANEKLERISNIFKQISHKTTVINDIAFKTKMLSINAAVEAARAGQHGRGFSVVASEVGNLSKLSAEAANAVRALLANSQQEVSDIIETTSAQVRAGSRVTSAVDLVFSEIAKAVQQVAEQAVAISQAANEQELGVKQTASGIEQIHSKMLETRGVAEETRTELSVINEQSSRLVALGLQLRRVLYGSGEVAVGEAASRSIGGNDPTDNPGTAGGIDDVEAAALVRRLGEAARQGRNYPGAPAAANDNTARNRAAV